MKPALRWDTLENLASLAAAVGAWVIGARSERQDVMRDEVDFWRANYDAMRLTLVTERDAWQVREEAFKEQLEANAARQIELEAEAEELRGQLEAVEAERDEAIQTLDLARTPWWRRIWRA